MQALLSLHARLLLAKTQPLAGEQLSVVQGLPSSQSRAGPAVQAPFAQTSPCVHALPSEQPSGLCTNAQPLTGLQMSTVQALPSLHVSVLPAVQVPFLHTSFCVQALPSEQNAAFLTATQPCTGWQASVVQGLLSSQASCEPGLQVPAWVQTSPVVQAVPSLHGNRLGVLTQPPEGSQVSVVHGLASSHCAGASGLQMPPVHASPVVQLLPSSQGKLLFTKAHPAVESQLSLVQGLPSLHTSALPG